MNITRKDRIKAIAWKIRPQFLEKPEGKFMFAIVERALADIGDFKCLADVRSACRYLNNDLIHAELAGVDPQWIREVISRAGIKLTFDPAQFDI